MHGECKAFQSIDDTIAKIANEVEETGSEMENKTLVLKKFSLLIDFPLLVPLSLFFLYSSIGVKIK